MLAILLAAGLFSHVRLFSQLSFSLRPPARPFCLPLSSLIPPSPFSTASPLHQLSASAELRAWSAAHLTALASLRFTDDEAAVYRTPKGSVYRSAADVAKKEAAEAAAAAKKKPAASAGMLFDSGVLFFELGFS